MENTNLHKLPKVIQFLLASPQSGVKHFFFFRYLLFSTTRPGQSCFAIYIISSKYFFSANEKNANNRCWPNLKPTWYEHKILQKYVLPFRRSLVINTATWEFYILYRVIILSRRKFKCFVLLLIFTEHNLWESSCVVNNKCIFNIKLFVRI